MLKSGMLAVVVFTPYLMMFIYRNEILGFAQMEPNDWMNPCLQIPLS